MRLSRPLAAALALAAASLGNTAHAQSKGDAYTYHFEDDYMVGDTLATTPPLLRVRRRPPIVTLLRPRASFVAEMLKSVEAL
jgi:hypothetical protein